MDGHLEWRENIKGVLDKMSARAVALRFRENEGYVRDSGGVRWIYIRNTAI